MKYKIDIKEKSSGKINSFEEEYIDDDIPYWQYTEGNYSCDCNRKLFFYRVDGIDKALDGLICGDIEYDVDVYNVDTEEYILKEI